MGKANTSFLLDALDKRWNEYQEQLKLYRREASREAKDPSKIRLIPKQ